MCAIQMVMFVSCLSYTGESSEEKQPINAISLIGSWRSVKHEGDDLGSAFVGFDAKFVKDGSVSMTAKVKQEDEGVKEMKADGTFKVTKEKLQLTFDNRTQTCKSWFQNDLLIIEDPDLDSRVYYERVMPDQ